MANTHHKADSEMMIDRAARVVVLIATGLVCVVVLTLLVDGLHKYGKVDGGSDRTELTKQGAPPRSSLIVKPRAR
jgi:hypothetical protein